MVELFKLLTDERLPFAVGGRVTLNYPLANVYHSLAQMASLPSEKMICLKTYFTLKTGFNFAFVCNRVD